MQTWKTIDKSEWCTELCDEFLDEPDKAHWIDEETKLDCLIVRGPAGALCGYVGVPNSHPFFEVEYSNIDHQIEVHGGLTFSDKCSPDESPEKGICHTGNVANKIVWWLGFDCAHGCDIVPKYDSLSDNSYSTYRTFGYVKKQVEYLARQLA